MRYDFLKSNTSQILGASQAMLQFQNSLATHALVSSNIGKTIINASTKPLTFSSKNWFDSLFPATSALSAKITKQSTKGLNIAALTASNLATKELSKNLVPVIKTPTFPSVSQFHEVQELVRTINNLALDDSIFPSDTINDINNADVHIDTVDVSEEFAFNISSALEDDDIFVETGASQTSKSIYIDAFKKYLIIFISFLLPLISFSYTLWHDYVSDKATSKYQSQMLKEEHQQTIEAKKQTRLSQNSNNKSSKNNSSTSTEKH